MQQRAERDRDERELALDRRVAHVALAEVDLDARELGALARDLEHPGGGVDADDAIPAAAIGTAIRPVPTPSSSIGPPERTASST